MDQALIDEIVNEAVDRAADYYRAGDHTNAEALYRQILCVNPDHIIALQMLGLIESRKKNQQKEALDHLLHALELEPDSPDVHNNLGLVYSWSDSKDNDKAIYHYKKCIELKPESLLAYSNLGIHYKSMGLVEESETILKEALKMDPDNTAVHFNYATLLGELHRWDEAIEHYEFVLTMDPDNPSAHYNLSNVLLVLRRWEEGWRHYEWRWETYPIFRKVFERFTLCDDPKPFWRGEPLQGKRVLLYAEQGIGDSLQFIRFCPVLKAMGAHVIVEEHADLIPLLKNMDGIDELVAVGEPLPEFDYHQSLVSLPLYTGLYDPETWPKAPYLRTNYDALPDISILDESNWEVYDDLFRVGIVWGGNPVHRNDHIRSTRLKYFKDIQIPGVKLFSLQKDIRERYWPGRGVQDLAEDSHGMGVVDLKEFMLDYNCLKSDTKFITSLGVKCFDDFRDGDEITVLTHTGKWKKAMVRCYGEDYLYPSKFRRIGGHEETIWSTSNHRWLISDKEVVETKDLEVGCHMHLPPSYFNLFDYDNATPDERMWWAYGYVYGDGTCNKYNGEKKWSMVRLCGKDKSLYKYRFEELGFSVSEPKSFSGDAVAYTGTYLKQPPDPTVEPVEYIRAFVRGYLDADGAKQLNATNHNLFGSILTNDPDHASFIRNCFPVAGVYLFKENNYSGRQTNFGTPKFSIRFNLCTDFAHNTAYKYLGTDWNSSIREPVWCLEVEDDHSFITPSGLITGNCSAALIDRMDLIISVDTATAHLAGAMGKPVWLIVPWHSEWRWMLDRSDTPYYPSMRIFRQTKADDWTNVFEEMREELKLLTANEIMLPVETKKKLLDHIQSR